MNEQTLANEETIVAVYDTAEHAALAVRDLDQAGVPPGAITQHAGNAPATGATTASSSQRGTGFWSNLIGGEPEHAHDTGVYDRSLQSGATVVSVKTPEQHIAAVMDILERHNPVDIDERAASYGVTQTTTQTTTPTMAPATASGTVNTAAAARASDGEVIPLAEETLAVGKRAVNRGTTRVRRYVVETPVEEQVRLRDETVSIERRPVTGGRATAGADFTDKVIEVTETGEEAVVSKSARVVEEVVVQKNATERTEAVHDTVRREQVEVTNEPGRGTTGASTVPPISKT